MRGYPCKWVCVNWIIDKWSLVSNLLMVSFLSIIWCRVYIDDLNKLTNLLFPFFDQIYAAITATLMMVRMRIWKVRALREEVIAHMQSFLFFCMNVKWNSCKYVLCRGATTFLLLTTTAQSLHHPTWNCVTLSCLCAYIRIGGYKKPSPCQSQTPA